MRAVTISCESTLPGLDSYRFRCIHRVHDQIMPWPGKVLLARCCFFQMLLLQKLKEHVACLGRCLVLWHNGDISALLKEGKCIQDHLQSTIQSGSKPKNIAQIFDCLMSSGKVSAALKLLSEDTKGGVLSLDSQIPCRVDSSGGTLSKECFG